MDCSVLNLRMGIGMKEEDLLAHAIDGLWWRTAFSSHSNFCLLDLWDLQYSLVIAGEFCSQKFGKSGYLFLLFLATP